VCGQHNLSSTLWNHPQLGGDARKHRRCEAGGLALLPLCGLPNVATGEGSGAVALATIAFSIASVILTKGIALSSLTNTGALQSTTGQPRTFAFYPSMSRIGRFRIAGIARVRHFSRENESCSRAHCLRLVVSQRSLKHYLQCYLEINTCSTKRMSPPFCKCVR
jgi:hypothetical protein